MGGAILGGCLVERVRRVLGLWDFGTRWIKWVVKRREGGMQLCYSVIVA